MSLKYAEIYYLVQERDRLIRHARQYRARSPVVAMTLAGAAEQIKSGLTVHGVEVKDGPSGTTWRIVKEEDVDAMIEKSLSIPSVSGELADAVTPTEAEAVVEKAGTDAS